MNQSCLKSIILRASVGWLWLLASCTPATGVEPEDNAQPAAAPASDAAPAGDQEGAKPTDIIDRMFSPLDNAVDDINRDLNKGETGTTSAPDE